MTEYRKSTHLVKSEWMFRVRTKNGRCFAYRSSMMLESDAERKLLSFRTKGAAFQDIEGQYIAVPVTSIDHIIMRRVSDNG
jgi:hypothetical protein